jgi:hypothetical protein
MDGKWLGKMQKQGPLEGGGGLAQKSADYGMVSQGQCGGVM